MGDIMAMERDLLMLSQMPNQPLMLMLMLMPLLGMVPMAMVAMVLVMEDMLDTMEDIHTDTDIADTGERRRGLLMPSLQLMLMPMPMPTLGMDITDMDIVHMGMDT